MCIQAVIDTKLQETYVGVNNIILPLASIYDANSITTFTDMYLLFLSKCFRDGFSQKKTKKNCYHLCSFESL